MKTFPTLLGRYLREVIEGNMDNNGTLFYCLSNNYVKDVNNNYDVQGEPLPCDKKSYRDQVFKY